MTQLYGGDVRLLFYEKLRRLYDVVHRTTLSEMEDDCDRSTLIWTPKFPA